MIEKGLTILVALVSVVLVGGMLEQYAGLPPGPYCGQGGGRGKCCSGRLDSCAALITGTPCYCDEFCNRTRSSDCCPDYWSFCLGISEPDEPGVILSCEYGGKYFSEGQTIKVNCNECVCVGVTNTTSRLDCTNLDCIIEPRVNEEVNGDEAIGWTARNHSAFWGRTLEDGIKLRLGTLQPERTTMRMTPLRRVERARLPKSFDARSNWRNLIAGIIDQGWCGASWAISTATVASDRFSVMSKGKEHVLLSAQQLLSCNNRGQQSCSGGHLDRAWQYVRKFGLVDEACYPYDQSSGYCKVPKRGNLLEAGCKPLSNGAKRIERYRTSPAHRLAAQEDIMHEIFTSGPVQATMRVNQDFFSYSGGVYRKSTYGTPHRASYHSVRIIGWGEENGVPYWLAANSWGEEWGERGYFRIRRGVNECEIESFILGVWANVAAPYQRIYNHGTNQV